MSDMQHDTQQINKGCVLRGLFSLPTLSDFIFLILIFPNCTIHMNVLYHGFVLQLSRNSIAKH